MPAGRPQLYKNKEALSRIVDLYFLTIKVHIAQARGDEDALLLLDGLSGDDLLIVNDIDDVRPTMSGLALALNMDRRSLLNYSKKEKYFPTIKKARDRIESALEQNLYGHSVAGTIFNLKNNFDWEDKSHTDLTSKGESITFNSNFGNGD